MDLETLVAVAHARLRARRYLFRLEKQQQRLIRGLVMSDERKPLKIRMPIELAGLKSRMIRAEGQEKAIADLGKRYDRVQHGIDELIGAHREHAGALEVYEQELRRKIEGMVGTNGDPNDDQAGQTGQQSVADHGQVISSETQKS